MSTKAAKVMPGKNQVNISLSDGAESEFDLVASWLGVPKASLLRQKLEEVHQSPNFASVLRRAKSAHQAKSDIEELTGKLREYLKSDPEALKLLKSLELKLQALVSGVPHS